MDTLMTSQYGYGPDIVKIVHNAGFFSCSTVRLLAVTRYFNNLKKLPKFVDSIDQYALYRTHKTDVTFQFYEHYNSIIENIEYMQDVDFYDANTKYCDKQFTFYKHLDFNSLNPFIRKYFTPSLFVRDKVEAIKMKYGIQLDKTCALFHRGNDKGTETKICTYEEKIEKAKELFEKNPKIIFMIQSDETEFIEIAKLTFPNNSFCCEDEIMHIRHDTTTMCDYENRDNIENRSQNFLAIMIIMSACKHLITSSGNCDLWISLYRGHSDNLIQYCNGEWNCN